MDYESGQYKAYEGLKPLELERMSVTSLNEYLNELEKECLRVKNEINKKTQYISNADSFFIYTFILFIASLITFITFINSFSLIFELLI